MHRVVLFFWVWLMFVGCGSTSDNQDLQLATKRYGFFGRIRTVSMFSNSFYRVAGFWHEHPKRPVGEQRFRRDHKERLREIRRLDARGDIMSRRVFKYDTEGKLLKESEYGDKSQPLQTVHYAYDRQHRIRNKTVQQQTGGVRLSHTFRYDSRGNPVEEIVHTDTGTLVEKIETSYNSRGLPLLVVHFDADGKEISRETYSYDEDGRRLESRLKTDTLSVLYKWNLCSDVQEKIFYKGTSAYKKLYYNYKYDKVGNWTRMVIYSQQLKSPYRIMYPQVGIYRKIRYYHKPF